MKEFFTESNKKSAMRLALLLGILVALGILIMQAYQCKGVDWEEAAIFIGVLVAGKTVQKFAETNEKDNS